MNGSHFKKLPACACTLKFRNSNEGDAAAVKMPSRLQLAEPSYHPLHLQGPVTKVFLHFCNTKWQAHRHNVEHVSPPAAHNTSGRATLPQAEWTQRRRRFCECDTATHAYEDENGLLFCVTSAGKVFVSGT